MANTLERVTREHIKDPGFLREWLGCAGLKVSGVGLVLPFAVCAQGAGLDPQLLAVDENPFIHAIELGTDPHTRIRGFHNDDPRTPPGSLGAFRHRKGGSPDWEPRARLLRLTGEDDLNFPPTEFYVGEHHDHPGQNGLHVYAEHVGGVSLRCLNEGSESPTAEEIDMQLLPEDAVVRKYFPFGVTAEMGLPL